MATALRKLDDLIARFRKRTGRLQQHAPLCGSDGAPLDLGKQGDPVTKQDLSDLCDLAESFIKDTETSSFDETHWQMTYNGLLDDVEQAVADCAEVGNDDAKENYRRRSEALRDHVGLLLAARRAVELKST